jgi:integrase
LFSMYFIVFYLTTHILFYRRHELGYRTYYNIQFAMNKSLSIWKMYHFKCLMYRTHLWYLSTHCEDMKWALKRFCSQRDYILFLIGINTGLRIGDLLQLKTKEVRRKKRMVILKGKTKKPRTIHFENIYEEVQDYVKTLDTKWLFSSRKEDKPISVQAYRQLNKAADMAEITEGIGTHTMRKTFGYWVLQTDKRRGQAPNHLKP